MYRFLLSAGWLGRLAAALALALVMVLLGLWQLDRYEQRSAINQRIDAAEAAQAAGQARELTSVLTAPAPAEAVGPAPPAGTDWAMVSVTGRYDPDHEILVRSRPHQGRVGVEVVTPLVRSDGSAVLIDRGWVPPAATGTADRPEIPPVPTGEVTVRGWVRTSERPAGVHPRDGDLYTRRIAVAEIADHVPHRLFGGYLLLAGQEPAPDPGLTLLPPRRENAWLNAGYAAQWWIFAGLVLVGYGWLARRHAHRDRAAASEAYATAAPTPGGRSPDG